MKCRLVVVSLGYVCPVVRTVKNTMSIYITYLTKSYVYLVIKIVRCLFTLH